MEGSGGPLTPLEARLAGTRLRDGDDGKDKKAAAAAAAAAAAPAVAEASVPEEGMPRTVRKKLNARLVLQETDEVFSVRFSPDGRWLAAGCGDGGIRVYSSNSGKLHFSVNAHKATATGVTLPTTCVRFRPLSVRHKTKNIFIAAGSDGTLKHFHMTSEKCVHTITEPTNQIYCCDYRPDAEMFATAGKDVVVRTYDESTKQLVSKHSGGSGDITAGHSNRIFSLKFHPQHPQIMLTGGWDNTVQIWDIRASNAVRSIFGPHVCGDAVDAIGDTVLTGSWRPTENLELWDFGSGKLISRVNWKPHLGTQPTLIYCCQFSKEKGSEFIVAGGTGSNECKVFSREGGNKVLVEILARKGIYTTDLSEDGRMLALGGAGLLMIYDPNLKK